MSARRPDDLDQLASAEIDADDVRVLGQLATVFDTLDPVPAGLVERTQFAMTLDALQAEIAELQRAPEAVGARSGEQAEAQTVTFTSASLTTMVTITPTTADRVRIDGWAAPGSGVAVELRLASQTLSTTADSDGRFVFEDVPRGLGQFVLRPQSGTAQPSVVTPSIDL